MLVFSFIGMKTQEIVLKDDKPLKVVMQEDAKEIDEVVVTGIFNRKKDSFTGASATFDGEQLRSVGTQNVIASLKHWILHLMYLRIMSSVPTRINYRILKSGENQV